MASSGQNPEWVPLAVEEMLRYRFHNAKRHRTVKQDNQLLGVDLKKEMLSSPG